MERLILKLRLQYFGHLVDLKISHRLKAESVLFNGKILRLQAWETASQGAPSDHSEETGERVSLYTNLQQRAGSMNIKDYC